MTYGSIQQVKLILKTELFKPGSRCGIQFGVFRSMRGIDMIHIVHQIKSSLPSCMLIKGAAEIIGNIVFAIGEGSGTAESAHNGAGLAADTGSDLFSVNGTPAFFQRIPSLKYSNLQIRWFFCKLIGGVNTSWPGSYYNDIVVHNKFLRFTPVPS